MQKILPDTHSPPACALRTPQQHLNTRRISEDRAQHACLAAHRISTALLVVVVVLAAVVFGRAALATAVAIPAVAEQAQRERAM